MAGRPFLNFCSEYPLDSRYADRPAAATEYVFNPYFPGTAMNVMHQIRLQSPVSEHGNAAGSGADATASSNRILVVDDNEDAADSLAMLLEYLGRSVRVANSGQAALDTLAEFTPGVILMDIGMPGMDGNEVARRIREMSRFSDVTLIALSGWGQEEDKRRSSESGFDHHLTKPVDLGKLESLLAAIPAQGQK